MLEYQSILNKLTSAFILVLTDWLLTKCTGQDHTAADAKESIEMMEKGKT